MSVWKSPLLYVGILLILVAGAALAVPPFIDWNQYRSDIEEYGRQLTGRDVKVAGDVHARLFPWPRVWLDDVRIANPPGAKFPDLVATESLEIGLSLAPLISGKVVVESIEVERPVFAFERLASGEGTWAIEPTVRFDDLIDVGKITVAGIKINDGTLVLADARRGGAAKLEDMDAVVSAPGLDGPWRLRGAASYGEARTTVAIATGKYRAHQPLRFSFNLSPEDGAGLSYVFDGTMDTDNLTRGKFKVRPAKSKDGKSNTELDIRPVNFSADVTAAFDKVELQNIEIAPDAKVDAGNFVTGSAEIALGSRIRVDTRLKAAKFDLDEMAGSRARQAIYSGTVFSTLSSILAGLPREVDGSFAVDVTSLVFGGENLDSFRIAGDLRHDRLKITELGASMPGQTTGKLSGIFVPDDKAPQFSGDFTLDTISLRDFVVWAVPEQRESIETVWSGARGKLKLSGKFDVNQEQLRLTADSFEFDEAKGLGSFSLSGGDTPGMAMRLVADRLDVDRYAPKGLSRSAVQSDLSSGLTDLVAGAMERGDVKIIVQADELRLHGVNARDIAIDAGVDADGVELRTVEIGQVGDARLNVAGLLKFPGTGVSGALRADIKAQDARGLLRLFGAIPRDVALEPPWAGGLGAVDVEVIGEAKTDQGATTASVKLSGTAGETIVSGQANFSGDAEKWREGDVDVSAGLKATDANVLAKQLGLRLHGNIESGATATLKINGIPGEGMNARIDAEVFGAQAQFVGKASVNPALLPVINGRLAMLAERAQALYAALGLAPVVLSPSAQILSAEGEFGWSKGIASYKGVNGSASGSAFKGDVVADFSGDGLPAVRLRGNVGRLDLGWLVGLQMYGQDGQTKGLETGFALPRELPVGIDIDVKVKRLEVGAGTALNDAMVVLRDDGTVLALETGGELGLGQTVKGNVKLERRAYDVAANVSFDGDVSLSDMLSTQERSRALTGSAHVSLDLEGNGRSAAGVLSSMSGQGEYALERASLDGVNVSAFAIGLQQLKDAKLLDKVVQNRLATSELLFDGGKGDVRVETGVVRFSPLEIEADGARGPLRVVVDLASGGVDISALLEMDAIKGLPPFEVAFAGPPHALQRSFDLAALKSFIGVNVLAKGLDKLEELQREQERIFRQESSFDREQVLKDLERAAEKRRREAAAEAEAARKAEAERLEREAEAKRSAEEEAAQRLAQEAERRAAEQREQQQRLEQERLEQERLEQERLEAERRKAEEVLRQRQREEQERAARRAEQLRAQQEAEARKRLERSSRQTETIQRNAPVPTPAQKPQVVITQPTQNTLGEIPVITRDNTLTGDVVDGQPEVIIPGAETIQTQTRQQRPNWQKNPDVDRR